MRTKGDADQGKSGTVDSSGCVGSGGGSGWFARVERVGDESTGVGGERGADWGGFGCGDGLTGERGSDRVRERFRSGSGTMESDGWFTA